MIPRCSIKGCTEKPVSMSKCATHLTEWKQGHRKPVKARSPIKTLRYTATEVKTQQKPRKSLPRRKPTGDAQFFRMLYEKWVADEVNHCLECGRWLSGGVFNFAHVVGDGESGSHKGAAFDPENVVPMCQDHHTQMDHGLDGKTRQDMKCYPVLEERRKLIVDRYSLKVKRE